MVVSTFRGELREFDASLVADEHRVALTGSGRVASIDVRDGDLVVHLLAPDFFDAERHPDIGLVSDSIRLDGESVTTTGELTIKGTAHRVQLTGSMSGPVADPFGAIRLGLDLTTTIDRRAFGLEWNVQLPGGGLALGNEVTISAQLELVRED
jgi:polyisoprenoid-binding protein YceI